LLIPPSGAAAASLLIAWKPPAPLAAALLAHSEADAALIAAFASGTAVAGVGGEGDALAAEGRPDPRRGADLGEFIALLGELRAWEGLPSFRVLARRAGLLLVPPREIAYSTAGDAFLSRRRRLDLDLVTAIFRPRRLAVRPPAPAASRPSRSGSITGANRQARDAVTRPTQ